MVQVRHLERLDWVFFYFCPFDIFPLDFTSFFSPVCVPCVGGIEGDKCKFLVGCWLSLKAAAV